MGPFTPRGLAASSLDQVPSRYRDPICTAPVTLPVHTRARCARENPCTPGLLLYRCSARCCLRPRGLVSHSPWRALTHGLRVGQYDQQTPKLSRSRGSVSDSGHAPFTSPNAHCHSSGSGRLDRPYPGRLLLCVELWHTFLLSSGSEPG